MKIIPELAFIEVLDDVANLTFFGIAAVLILAAMLTITYEQIQRLDKLDKIETLEEGMRRFGQDLNSVRDIVKEVSEVSLDLLRKSSLVLKDATGLGIDEKVRASAPKLVQDGVGAVNTVYRAWSDHINKTDDPVLCRNWLYYLKTYFREEAFDIQRKEIVTNARNYPFLLITTLLAFLEATEKEKGKKVHFYAVTPVHPKDWYNWPHGSEKPHRYYEEPFIAQYRRILRGMRGSKNWGRICHGRFLLVAENEPVAKNMNAVFGWELEQRDRVVGTSADDIDLDDWHILDTPVTCSALLSKNKYPSLHRIYRHFVGEDQDHMGERYFIPLVCTKRNNYKPLEKKLGIDLDQLQEEIKRILRDNHLGDDDKVKLQDRLLENLGELERKLETEVDQERRDSVKNAIDCVKDHTKDHNSVDFTTFIEQVQYLSLKLYDHHELVDKILENSLRIRDAHDPSSRCWCTLRDRFVSSLHSEGTDVALICLQKEAQSKHFSTGYWKSEKLPNEFAVFGVATDGGDPDWRLVLTTDVSYPFTVARIRLYNKGEHDPDRKKRFKTFEEVIAAFLKEKKDTDTKIHLTEGLAQCNQ